MPKLKVSVEEQKNNIIRACIVKNMTLYNLSDEQIALKLGCTKRTFQNKKKVPETFTFGELRKLCKVMKFTDEEKISII